MIQISQYYNQSEIKEADFVKIFERFVDKVLEYDDEYDVDRDQLIDELAVEFDIYYYQIKNAICYYFDAKLKYVIAHLIRSNKPAKDIKDKFKEEFDMII